MFEGQPEEQERRVAVGDVEAVKALLAAHAPMTYSYVRHKVGDADVAAELTREALLRFAKALWEGSAGEAPVQHGLLRIARDVVIAHYQAHGATRPSRWS